MKTWGIVFVLVVAFVVVGNINKTNSSVVEHVIDGDTIIMKNDQRVRLIGIDAAEIETSQGKKAKTFLKNRIEGERVTLQTDPQKPNKGKYDRLLRYVHHEGTDLSALLLREGFAEVAYFSDYERYEKYRRIDE